MNRTPTPDQEHAALAWLSLLHDQPSSGDQATFSHWLRANPGPGGDYRPYTSALHHLQFATDGQAAKVKPLGQLRKDFEAPNAKFVLATLGEQIDAVLDVTLVYPGQQVPGFWALLSGQVPKVIIDIQTLELDPALYQGDYENDAEFRQYLQEWVSQLWRDKDARIERLREHATS